MSTPPKWANTHLPMMWLTVQETKQFVIRKVIVEEGSPADNYSTWLADSGLADLPRATGFDADPDGDGLTVLPNTPLALILTSGAFMVTPDISGGSLSITFVRLKSSTDAL